MINFDEYFTELDNLCPGRLNDDRGWREITIPGPARSMIGYLVAEFSGFVGAIAREYTGGGHRLDYDDLWQEGAIGLIVAIWKYEPALGSFVSYAKKWVKASIIRAINTSYIIRLPINNVLEAAQAGDEAARAIKDQFAPVSLDKTITEGEEGYDLVESGYLVEDVIERADYRRYIDSILDKLPARQARIIYLRYGLLDGAERTYTEIGKMFGLTRPAIQKIELKARDSLTELINQAY